MATMNFFIISLLANYVGCFSQLTSVPYINVVINTLGGGSVIVNVRW